MTDPVRINKYLADRGTTTRKGADALVAAGKVRINGKLAKLGDKVHEGDRVEVAGAQTSYAYYAYHKPRGIITHSPGPDERSITDVLPPELRALKLFPVGRLDKDSYGLIILTNDGRVTKRMLDPEHEHEKEYVVKVARPLPGDFERRMGKGVFIEGYVTKPAKVSVLGAKSFNVILTEGKKHQIRRMVAAFGNEVVDLKRVRVGTVRMGKLAPGEARELSGAELARLLGSLSLA